MAASKDLIEKLAFLYLEQQDISGLTPEELFDKFAEICERM